MRAAAICSFLVCLSIGGETIRAGEQAFDVVVYGATPGGITAAVAAARQRASVVLIEPSRHIGGMVSGGLSATDYGNSAYIGGLALEFFDRAAAKYRNHPAALTSLGKSARWFSEPTLPNRPSWKWSNGPASSWSWSSASNRSPAGSTAS